MNPNIQPLRTASLIAGLGPAFIVVLALGNFGAIQLSFRGEIQPRLRRTSSIPKRCSDGASLAILAAVLDMIVAGALLVLFEPVSRGVSTMAALFRVAYAAVFRWPSFSLRGVGRWTIQPKRCAQSMRTTQSGHWLDLLRHLVLIGYRRTDPGMAKVRRPAYRRGDRCRRRFGTVLVPNYQSTSRSSPSSAKRR